MFLRPFPNTIWNLFLAAIPATLAVFIFFGIRRQQKAGKVTWVFWAPLFAIWFLFLPNTCYLLLEWRHFLSGISRDPAFLESTRHDPVNLYLCLGSILFYVLYTGSGLICFYLSIYPIDLLFKPPWYVRGIVGFLCSLGVYLGLVDRFNSWQAVTHPHLILHSIEYASADPPALFLIFAFGALLWLLYGLFGLTMDGLRVRYRNIRAS